MRKTCLSAHLTLSYQDSPYLVFLVSKFQEFNIDGMCRFKGPR